jgi:oligoribonuclease NrnB/cAMP/cGMP phosphodiesterase (DHH superfamily)
MNWENEARRIVKAELARRGFTYERLAKRLKTIGINETERSIANKMSRGTFSFVFFLQCMQAIGNRDVNFCISVDPRIDDDSSKMVNHSETK